jgi:hypothetical protein
LEKKDLEEVFEKKLINCNFIFLGKSSLEDQNQTLEIVSQVSENSELGGCR